jgi:DNA polymerase (family X)
MTDKKTNAQLAEVLENIADLLDAQDANPSRIEAYRRGAQTIRDHDESLANLIHQERFNDITAIPTIGGGITSVLTEYVVEGQSRLLNDLQAQVSPVQQLAQVQGLDADLAQRVHEELHIESVEDLQDAVEDGRLGALEGFDEARLMRVKQSLADRREGNRSKRRDKTASPQNRAPVALLLELDEEYRRRAEQGDLVTVAPRRFNPDNEPWLPILKTERDGYHFTVLFSNTELAHKLGRTNDWVVIYYERNGEEQQNTVVTEFRGPLKGKRVVRGRDADNKKHYEALTETSQL